MSQPSSVTTKSYWPGRRIFFVVPKLPPRSNSTERLLRSLQVRVVPEANSASSCSPTTKATGPPLLAGLRIVTSARDAKGTELIGAEATREGGGGTATGAAAV